MIICDSHVHSEFSSDSSAPLDSIIQKAIQLGIPKICLTDHHDIDFPINLEDGFDFQLDFESYFAALDKIRDRYRSKIDVRSGVELGLMNTVADKARDIAGKYKNELDFIIGSSHLVRGLDPYYPAYYEGRTEIEGIHDYFESILENVTLIDDFDVYGHLDYVVRYCPSGEKAFKMSDYRDVFEQIFKIIIPKGKSEALILKYNPGWTGCGDTKHPVWVPDEYLGYFDLVMHDEFYVNVPFTRESWHGRMRACRGVGASLSTEKLKSWDSEHREMLKRIAPEHFDVKHYIAIAELDVRK